MEAILLRQEDRYETLEKTATNYKKSPKERITKSYIESKLDSLENLWAKFGEDHSLIVSAVKKADKAKLDYFKDDDYMSVEEKYTIYKAKLKEDLNTFIQRVSQMPTTQTSLSTMPSCEVKLPQIKLPSFSGKYDEWQTFNDMFVSLIHENKSLSDVQRLHYLKSSLSGEPENLLKNLAITESNYTEAWKQLKKRYENKRFNANEIMKRLFNQKNITSESANAIKTLLDTTSSCLKSFNNLGIDTSSWDTIIIYLVVSKLDNETRKMWEHKVGTDADDADDLPRWSQLTEFLELRFRALEMIADTKPTTRYEYQSNKSQQHSNTKSKSFHSTVQESKIVNNTCTMCSGQHLLYQCKQFGKQTPQERSEFVQSKRLCYNCLAPSHSVKSCHQAGCCRRCGRRHHSLLHFEREINPGSISTYQQPTNTEKTVNQVGENITASGSETRVVANFSKEEHPDDKVLLATATVRVKSKNGCAHIIRALLDQGSMASFVTEATVQLLGLKKIPVNSLVSGLGEGETRIKTMVSVTIESRHKPDASIQVNAFVLSSLTSLLPTSKISKPDWLEVENLTLADASYESLGRIDILLGAEVYAEILLDGMIKKPHGPIAQNTLFGWILSGRVHDTPPSANQVISLHVGIKEDFFLKKFWEIENEPDAIQKKLTKEEEQCEEKFESTTERNQDGRYVVRLPVGDDNPECQYGHSKEIAQRRFEFLEKKLIKNPILYDEYKGVMKEYLELNHMEQITEDVEINNERAIYLPHHAVVREDKATTKVRVVFDASCQGINKVSLNDNLLVGPKLQQDLRHILLRWRYHPICLVADIVKMYRQVRVHKDDTDFQRILWRFNPQDELQHYRLLTLTFGTASAPYLAVKALQQLAKDEKSNWPIASNITLTDFYMDDLMTGCETENEALEIYRQMKELLNAGGFQLQKWSSNSAKVLSSIEEKRQTSNQSIPIKTDNMIKVLGISWNRETDNFEYSVQIPEEQQVITKRRVLSDIARLYDPMGWIAPVVVVTKILIQKLWKSGLAWDDELTGDLLNEWSNFKDDLINIKQIGIPRWLRTMKDWETELHTFADASQTAYAATVYMRVTDQSGNIHVSLVTAKTKVAPIEKEVSIPRLELCAALLAAKLVYEVAQVMNVPQVNLHAWSDSTVVLAWLRGLPNRWTTFVSNRVSEILTMINYDQWRHIETSSNPADCASRGLQPSELREHPLWWNGPECLRQPLPQKSGEEFTTNKEERTIKALAVTVEEEESFLSNRFSNFSKMLRVLSLCRRFINLNKQKELRENQPKFITVAERKDTLNVCVKQAQEFYFKEELDQLKSERGVTRRSPLHTLNPFLDKNGICRVGGRIHHAQVPYEKRHPIILPNKAHLTKLIVADSHNVTLHGGPQVMLNYLRSKYWIVRAKDLVKKCYRECVTCLRYAKQNNNQLMGQIPEVRLKPSKPFKATGVDYAGPIQIRFSPGRGSKSYKGYIALFVCMVTKAIHLEAVSDLSAQGFISAFRRFVSRRGHCSELYSDNGTNFVGADKQLREMLNNAKSELHKEIAETLTYEGTFWNFIPPSAPNFGGLWEAGVRSTKSHLKRVIGDSTLTFEELSTVLTQIEACLNSRPLTKMSDDPNDPLPLTPGHFLVGEPLVNIPDEDYSEQHITGLHRWRLVQKMVNDFWKRWSQEYLITLNQRFKWKNIIPEPQIDDIVIIKDDNLPPAKWLLGRVVAKHCGKDNITRVVTVKCKNSYLKRPLNKLCFIPSNV